MSENQPQLKKQFPFGGFIISAVGWGTFACIASVVGGITGIALGLPDTFLATPFLCGTILFAFIVNWRFFKAWGLTPYISMFFGATSLITWIMPLVGFPNSIVALIMSFISYSHKNNAWSLIGLICGLLGLICTTVNSALGAYMFMQ
jgi:hypothetical protein